jgi:hypothetical protein
MASRHLVALGSLVVVLFAFATISSCNGAACSDGGEGCSCTSPFDCDKFPSGCYRSYCDGTCHFEPFPAGSACAIDKCTAESVPCAMGVCTAEFACVECVENSHCSAGHTCEPDNVCSRCDDGVKNGDEIDIDCGGSCPLCPGTCNIDADCPGGYCWEGLCARCDDGIQNGDETGIDCGVYQGHCPMCFGNYCWSNDDCASKACENKYCCATPCPLCYECGSPNGECLPIVFGEYDFFNALDPLDICYADFVCDGKGKCGRVKNQPCTQDDACASAMCINGKCG